MRAARCARCRSRAGARARPGNRPRELALDALRARDPVAEERLAAAPGSRPRAPRCARSSGSRKTRARGVVGERDVAVRAAAREAAGLALDDARVAAAVEEQERPARRARARLHQLARRGESRAGAAPSASALAASRPSAQVDDLDARQRAPIDALGQREAVVLAAPRVVAGLERRRGRAEHARRRRACCARTTATSRAVVAELLRSACRRARAPRRRRRAAARGSGANTAERAPTTTSSAPRRAQLPGARAARRRVS